MGFITGKSKQKSYNQSYDYLKGAYGGQVSNGTGANNLVASLLGTGGTPGAGASGLDAFKKSAGYDNVINAGTQAIVGNNAARGLLRSGDTGKAITNFAQDTAQNYYNNYLQNLLGLSSQGTQAGQLISGAGNVQKSSSKPGLASAIGSVASAIPGIGPAIGIGSSLLGSVTKTMNQNPGIF